MGLTAPTGFQAVDVSEQKMNDRQQGELTRKKAFKNRFGILGILTLTLGMAVAVAIVVLLGLFWAWGIDPDKRSSDNSMWEQIALKGYSEQAVTVASALLRTIVGAQMLIGCYMLASYTLEYASLKGKELDTVYVYQTANEGPLSMCFIALKSLFAGNVRAGNVFATFIFLLLVVISIASQLTSTILLIDFETQVFANQSETRIVPFMADGRFECMNGDQTPIDYPVFAENSTDPFFIKGDDRTPGLYDSGWVHRAFYPLPKAEREKIISYDGPANVLSQRDICFPPIFNSTIQINATMSPSDEVREILAKAFAEYGYISDDFKVLQVPTSRTREFGGATGMTLGILIPRIDEENNREKTPLSSYLFYKDVHYLPKLSDDQPVVYNGEWAEVEIKETSHATHAYYTFCVRMFDWIDRRITSETANPDFQPIKEPVPVGNRTIFLQKTQFSIRNNWFTDSVRHLLSRDRAGKENPLNAKYIKLTSARNISDTSDVISITNLSNLYGKIANGYPNYYCDYSLSLGMHTNICYDEPVSFDPSRAITFCSATASGGRRVVSEVFPVSRQLVDIMNDTLTETGHAALAVQAYNTIVHSNSYLLNMPFFDDGQDKYKMPATIRFFAEASIPSKRLGFWVMVGLVGAHFAMLGTALALYMRTETSRSEISLEGVAQLKGVDAMSSLALNDLSEESGMRRRGDWGDSGGVSTEYRGATTAFDAGPR